MIIKIIYIASGGALGSILRFLVSNISKIYFPYFPLGTLLVNIVGSFFIGLLASYLNDGRISETIIRYFLIIGLLGSFTTFSAFSIETIELFKQDKIFMSLIYIILSLTLSVFAAYLGFCIIKN